MTAAGGTRSLRQATWVLRSRVAVREGRAVLRTVRGRPGWRHPTGALRLREGQQVELRLPRVADAVEWQLRRREASAELERWFPEPGDWSRAQTPLHWAERCARLRRAAHRGLALPSVVLVDGVLVGELGIDAVDPGTRSGELSQWLVPGRNVRGLAEAATALVLLRAFTQEQPLERVVVPRAVDNPASTGSLTRLGLTAGAVVPAYRETSRGREDHRIFSLVRSDDAVARIRERLAALTVDHAG